MITLRNHILSNLIAKLAIIPVLLLILVLWIILFPGVMITFAQGGNIGSNSSPTANRAGIPLPGVKISICQPVTTISASVVSNIAVLFMSSNPITVGFVPGMTIQVTGFTGADTYFNGGTFTESTGISNGYTILTVTASSISFGLTHANGSASSNGVVLQEGNATTSCAGLVSLSSTPDLANAVTQPLVSDQLGNWNAFAVPGLYYGQFYGPGVTTTVKTFVVSNGGNIINPSSINNIIYVNPMTVAAVVNALTAASASPGGGQVIVPPTGSTPIPMGSTGITVPSNVCLIGYGATLQWTGSVAGISTLNGTVNSCIMGLTLSFTSGATNSSALRIHGADGAASAQFNTYKDLYIKFSVLGSGSAGIYGTSTGPSFTDITNNHFENITIDTADQMVVCGGCEGNHWIGVRGQNLGFANGNTLFQFVAPEADEQGDIRIESGTGSGINLLCLALPGSNNLLRITCDGGTSGETAINDTGGYNVLDIDTVGTPTLGTIAATSSYRYASKDKTTAISTVPNLQANGTQSVSGCSLSLAVGGSWSGTFKSGTNGTCTVTITPGITAAHAFFCIGTDEGGSTLYETSSSNNTQCVIAGTTLSGDVIHWELVAH